MKPYKASDDISTFKSPITRARLPQKNLESHVQRIRDELKAAGALPYDLMLPETYYLPAVIHEDEHIMGSVYGRYHYGNTTGRGALVATDQRVIFLDKKPLFVHYDELTFLIIGSVSYTRTLLVGYITLHTRLGDFQLRTFNHKNAYNFVQYIEAKCLQKEMNDKREYDKREYVT